MDLVPKIPAGRQIISAYGDLGFRILGRRHEGSLLVFPDRTLAWPLADIGGLTLEHLAPVLAAEPKVELLLVGCGARQAALAIELRATMRARGVGMEALDTGAACRTYNVLLAEGRRIAAALIAVP
jgi:uncharacterized protein